MNPGQNKLSPPKRRKWPGRAAALLLAVMLLAALEGVFRLAGYGGFPPLVTEIGTVDGRMLVEVDPLGMQSYFFGAVPGRGSGKRSTFYQPKDTNTFRIVLAGESAILGFPHPKPLTAAHFLEWGIEKLWPGKDVEIINLGTTAVASFPVYDMVRQLASYDPDLVIVYTGNNEFYGSYGVCSTHFAGTHPAMLQFARHLQGLAFVQWMNKRMARDKNGPSEILMERMMASRHVAPDSSLRKKAAHNLSRHIEKMVVLCQKKNIPIIVCTLAANEKDMAPIGSSTMVDDPAPVLALAEYQKAQSLAARGRNSEAAESYVRAVDMDTMPWRPTSLQNNAIRDVAKRHGVTLCDVQASLRKKCAGESIGWEFMDDHVHFSLSGQYEAAMSMIDSIRQLHGAGSDETPTLPNLEEALRELGANMYESYASSHALSEIFSTKFMMANNSESMVMMRNRMAILKAQMDPAIRELFVQAIHNRGTPLAEFYSASGTAAEMLIRAGKIAEAEPLLDFACRSLPVYSKIRRTNAALRYTCRQKLGILDEKDIEAIKVEIKRGQILLEYGVDPSGIAEFAMAKMLALIGDSVESDRYMQSSVKKNPAIHRTWPWRDE